MNKIDRICILVTMVIIISSFGIYISKHIIDDYHSKVLLVNKKRIIEAAQKCVAEDKCNKDMIFLRELYNNQYLLEESNPLTREVYNYNSYVKLVDGEYVFYDLY